MKKTITKMLALAMASTMILAACQKTENNPPPTTQPTTQAPANNNTATTTAPPTVTEAPKPTAGQNEIKDLVYSKLATRELETFNVLYSQRAEDGENLTNLVDGLLESDPSGALVPAVAESWGTDDGGLTWKFNIRQGVKWVDMNANEKADCTSYDWATGMEWVLNFYKNDSSNTSMLIEMIKGAEEYYEYTKTLTEAEGLALKADEGSKFREMVGIETPDANTLIYHCTTQKPYFDSVGTYFCLYPIAQGMIDELGGPANVKAMNNTNMWYNGAYTLTEYIQGNEKIFTKNPKYWDTACERFDTVTFKMVESNDVAFQLYQSGEIDYVPLTEGNLRTIYNSDSNPFHDQLVPDVRSKYSYQFHLNYLKNKEDGTPDDNWNTAVANEAFRLTWYYGLDLVNWFKRTNFITPLVCENNFYTMAGLVYNSKGEEYTDMVRKELGLKASDGVTPARLDSAKLAEYKAKAIEELTALGVTFPVVVDYYISGSSQTALDSANVLKQIYTDCLGDDFCVLNIKTYVSSIRQEVVNPRLQSIAINGWGADYGDPMNYCGQETYGYDNAYYSAVYSNINKITEENDVNKELLAAYKEFTALVEAADAITDNMDARYAAFAKAEACMLKHGLVIPCYYAKGWALSKIDNSTRMNALFGSVNDKMKNWKTNSEGYTTEEAKNW